MPSLWKREKSPYWVCCYTGPRGERLKKSTKQTERNPAWTVCMEFSNAAKRGRQGALTESQARRVIGEIVERTTGEPLEFYTVKSWFEGWLAGKKLTTAPASHVRYKQVVDDFIKGLGNRANLNIAHIAAKDVLAHRDGLMTASKGPKTVNLAVKIVRSGFNAARRQGLIPVNPAEAVEMLPHQPFAKGTFSPEQVADIFEAAPSEDWRGAILFAYYTGARLQDVAGLRWASVDLGKGVATFTAKKTGQDILVPLHQQLIAWLTAAKADASGDYVFQSLTGRTSGGAHGLSRRFADIMTAAGIKAETARPKNGGKGRAISLLSFHSFRHTFNSAMANKGVAQEVRQKLTGHASAEMNKHYTHHEIEALRAAVAVIPSLSDKSASTSTPSRKNNS